MRYLNRKTMIVFRVLYTFLLTAPIVKCFYSNPSSLFGQKMRTTSISTRNRITIDMVYDNVGGKIVVTGIGKTDEDEFMLNLLNEQKIWDKVVLATDNKEEAQKRFLSRTARYSGLLNILEFEEYESSKISALLKDSTTWLNFNVSRSDIVSFTEQALASGVTRLVFSTQLPEAQLKDTELPEFIVAIKLCEDQGASFTGIRHGAVIDGDEDNAYEIVNASAPLMESTVSRGVLARVAAELLRSVKASNQECGLSASGEFAAAYLSVLRSAGLTRAQEVEKMLTGGLQRVARLTAESKDEKLKALEEKKAAIEKRKMELEREQEESDSKPRMSLAREFGILDEEEFALPQTDGEKIAKRSEEIMAGVWAEMEARMLTRSTTKKEFFDANKEKAVQLATDELEQSKNYKRQKIMELRSQQDFLDKYVDATRRQYAKLLNMERKELQTQKEMSDTWVKYIYLLLESTMKHCASAGTLFYNMDEFGQTMLLREQSNSLRKQCNIAPYEVIYDPLDASVIVPAMISQPLGVQLGLDRPADDLLPVLEEKYGKLLKSVPALRGATQIIELAIETLKKELPPPPPTVAELKQTESKAKQEMVAQLRNAALRNRGQPISGTGESVVGRL